MYKRQFVEGARHVIHHRRIVASDAHGDVVGSNDGGEVLRTVQHEMGIRAQQRLVLVRGRFALHGVDDHELVVSTLLAQQSGLSPGGKAGPAPSRKARRLQLF